LVVNGLVLMALSRAVPAELLVLDRVEYEYTGALPKVESKGVFVLGAGMSGRSQ